MIAGYAIGAHAHRLAIDLRPMETSKTILHQRLADCARIITMAVDHQRRVIWGVKRPFAKLPTNLRRSHTHWDEREQLVYAVERFIEEIDLTTTELNAGDPAGKLEIAARKIAARLNEHSVLGFSEHELPPGLDVSMKFCAHPDLVHVRLMRAYDILQNAYVTIMDAYAAVRPKS